VTGIWLVSYLVLWLFFLLQSAIVLALMRQLGLRVLNLGVAVSRDGLALGAVAPPFQAFAGTGSAVPAWSVVILASRTCQPCRALVPHINSLARELKSHAAVSILLDEASETASDTGRELGVARHVQVVAARGSHELYGVRVTPFAFLLDADNKVVAKGLVNNAADLKALWHHRHHLFNQGDGGLMASLSGGESNGHAGA
jgi:hypothetical protein